MDVKRLLLVGAADLIALAMVSFAASNPLEFADYPAKEDAKRSAVSPKVPADRTTHPGWRSVLTEKRQLPNFAGHYRISQDTCGSDSTLVLAADRRTGAVFMLGCFFWMYRFGANPRKDLPYRIEFRANSRLLIANGCREESSDCGTHFFEMRPGGFIHLRTVRFAGFR